MKTPLQCPRTAFLLLSVLLGASLPALAAEPAAELVTDRPDQTESAETVEPGLVQVETGGLFTREDEAGVRTEVFEAPGTLVRVGLAERLELRLGWSGWVREESRFGGLERTVDGVGDAEAGFKLRLGRGRSDWPAAALLVSTSVPVGADELTSDRFDPEIRLSIASDLTDRLSLGTNVGIGWETAVEADGAEHTLSAFLYTFALGIDLGGPWGAFVETFGEIPASARGDATVSLDGGVTYLARDNLQLDLYAGFGLTDEADDFFAGVGLSVRFPY